MSKKRPIDNSIFTVIDLVTSPEKPGEIIKIDAVKFDVDKIDFSCIDRIVFAESLSLVDPNTTAALKRLRELIGESRVVAFSPDDYALLLEYGERHKIRFPSTASDILSCAQVLFADSKLTVAPARLAEYFNLTETNGAALSAKIMLCLYKMNAESTEAVYYTPLYREVASGNEYDGFRAGMDAEIEIKTLERAHLAEAFTMLVDMLGELNNSGTEYKLNGAINMSELARCAEIIDTKIKFCDYYFSRFVNPYRICGVNVPCLSISVDIAPQEVERTVELMRGLVNRYPADETLFTVQTRDATELPEEYAIAERYNKSVLDITVNPSIELERFAALKKSVAQTKEITNKEVFEYIQKTQINVFDNAEKYLAVLSAIKPSRTDDVALAIAICERDMLGVLDEIVKFRQGEQSLRPGDIAEVLRSSGGVLMYQEHGMRILCELSGCSQFYADNIRRAMAKHDVKALERYKQAFLFGGEDVDGIRFGGCVGNDRMVAGRNYFAELCDKMPMLYLKAHASARAKFFIDCAKLQMQGEV